MHCEQDGSSLWAPVLMEVATITILTALSVAVTVSGSRG
jgi:hypothetical protein